MNFRMRMILFLSSRPFLQWLPVVARKETISGYHLPTLNSSKFSEADVKRLESLWKVACERSEELKAIADGLRKNGWSEEGISEYFYAVIFRDESLISHTYSHQIGVSLTVPSLEPTYPVPGGQGPVYLLPAQAKLTRRTYSRSSSGAGSIAALHFHSQKSVESRIFGNLISLYRRYKFNVKRQGASPAICKGLRDALVQLSGEDEVEKPDEDLGLESLTP